jgi:hypothetical protein
VAVVEQVEQTQISLPIAGEQVDLVAALADRATLVTPVVLHFKHLALDFQVTEMRAVVILVALALGLRVAVAAQVVSVKPHPHVRQLHQVMVEQEKPLQSRESPMRAVAVAVPPATEALRQVVAAQVVAPTADSGKRSLAQLAQSL